MQPFFSIVIPTYNRSEQVTAALASVLAQTSGDFEVIVVDDGSTDDTRERIAELCASDLRVKYVVKENGGRSSARNRGIDEARGKWLVFLDSDDLLEPSALDTFIELMREFPDADLIAGAKSFIDGEGRGIPPPWRENDPDRVYGIVDDAYMRLIRQFFFTPGTFCIRSEKCPHFNEEYAVCEDYDFLLQAAADCVVVRSPKPVQRYRWHSGNTDQGLFAATRLRIAGANESVVRAFADARRKRRAFAEWANRKADDFYELDRGLSAFSEYAKAIACNPSKITEGQIPRQLLACLLPATLRRMIRRKRRPAL